MAERHDAKKIIALAQECVSELENLIQAKWKQARLLLELHNLSKE